MQYVLSKPIIKEYTITHLVISEDNVIQFPITYNSIEE